MTKLYRQHGIVINGNEEPFSIRSDPNFKALMDMKTMDLALQISLSLMVMSCSKNALCAAK